MYKHKILFKINFKAWSDKGRRIVSKRSFTNLLRSFMLWISQQFAASNTSSSEVKYNRLLESSFVTDLKPSSKSLSESENFVKQLSMQFNDILERLNNLKTLEIS